MELVLVAAVNSEEKDLAVNNIMGLDEHHQTQLMEIIQVGTRSGNPLRCVH